MKAFEVQGQFGLENLRLAERPEPRPGPGEVLLRLRAASLNYRDLLVIRGQYNPRFRLPLVPVSDGVGEVAAVGPGVTQARIGERMAALFAPGWIGGEPTEAKAKTALGGAVDGVLSEYRVLPEHGVAAVPPHLTDDEAATLPCAGVTAWNALVTLGSIRPGDSVLVQGTGGVSIFALQFARLAGARVLVTSSRDEKLERAQALGAEATVNYRSTPDWDEVALRWTDGQGVDHVVEVGGSGTLARSLRAGRPGGIVSVIGVLSGRGDIDALPVLARSLRLHGIHCGSRLDFEAMTSAIAVHKLRPVVDRVFPFAEAPDALRYLDSGAHFGKVAIRF